MCCISHRPKKLYKHSILVSVFGEKVMRISRQVNKKLSKRRDKMRRSGESILHIKMRLHEIKTEGEKTK
jgi:hypothetical protein